MAKDKFLLENYTAISPKPITGIDASGKSLKAVGKGDINVYTTHGTIRLKDVLYVPGISRNLCSAAPLNRDGYVLNLAERSGTIAHGRKTIADVVYHQNLRFIDGYTTTTPSAFLAAKRAATQANQTTAKSLN